MYLELNFSNVSALTSDIKVPKTIKATKNDDILGWFSSSKCVLRKQEKEKNLQPIPSYSWREQTRLKNFN
jgi:hypothetical protein